MSNLSNDFEVRKETLRALGGNPDGLANIYEVDLEILKLTGGSGSGAASHESVDGVNYLTFVAIEDSTIKLKIVKNNWYVEPGIFEYSTDNAATWNSYTLDTEISLKAGENVKFRGDNPSGLGRFDTLNHFPSDYHQFVMTGKIAAYGSIMSLLSPTLSVTEVPGYGIYLLFFNCVPLIKAPELPATKLNSAHCYYGMFRGCSNLAVAPDLPALILSQGCYDSMFSGCTSLVESPLLPARELANDCYVRLFSDCPNLRKITCYSSRGGECDFWHERYFGSGFSKEGTFVKAKGAIWGIDDDMTGDRIPYGWSVVEVDVYKEAPMDDKQYARKNAEWTVVEEGLTDSPSDGKQYSRKDGVWVESEPSKVKTTSNTTLQFWNGTQQEYDAITTKDANTLYVIK